MADKYRLTPMPEGQEFEVDLEQTREFQFPESLSSGNPLVAFESNVYGMFNFVMKDGTRSQLEFTDYAPKEQREIKGEVRRIDLYTETLNCGQRLNCIMLYDKQAQRVCDAGYDEEGDKVTRIQLEEDELILGVRSRTLVGKPSAHVNFRFVIGKKV